jgi:hypothetical protein
MQPVHQSTVSNIRLILRSILPSGVSLMTGLAFAIITIGGHLLLVTLNGKAVPAFFDENALQAYTSTVIDPLLQLTNNVTINNSLGILMWALFGWALYAVVAFIVGSLSDIRSARQQVQYNAGVTIRSPMHRSLLLRLIWRLFISVLVVLYTILVSRAMHYALVQDYQILSSSHIEEILRMVGINLVIWIGLSHGYVVLLRWYVMRTRTFGEILY